MRSWWSRISRRRSQEGSPESLERALVDIVRGKKGICFDIIDIEDFPFGSALIMKPSRQLSEDEREEVRTCIKVKLYCAIPQAVAALNDESLKLIRDRSPVAYTEDKHGNIFPLPAWWVRYPGGIIGPLYFLTDWDEGRGLFSALLKKYIDTPSEFFHVDRETGNVRAFSGPPPVIGRIARGFLKGVRSIEI
jgi:hypothetical protein